MIHRLEKLQKSLLNYNVDTLLITNPTDLYYLLGLEMSVGKLIVSQKEAILIVDSRYIEECKEKSPVAVELEKKTTLHDVIAKRSVRLGFDSHTTSYAEYIALKKKFVDIPTLELLPIDEPLRKIRLIKDAQEQQIMRDVGALGSKGYDFLCTVLKTGITEREVALELEHFWLREGAEKSSFAPIIAFGKHSSMPHYHVSDTPLKPGPVLLDIGVLWKRYCSDMTRMVFFREVPKKMAEIHEIVRKAQEAALELCCPGTTVSELDHTARQIIGDAGYGDYFTHSLGHGLGLDIHEYPAVRKHDPDEDLRLEPGMAITIEPGIYLPDIGGVRIEDAILITPNGHENLTQRSKELRVL